MKPYYQDDAITLYNGDFRDFEFPGKPFDAIVTDPPYGETSLAWDSWPQALTLPEITFLNGLNQEGDNQ